MGEKGLLFVSLRDSPPYGGEHASRQFHKHFLAAQHSFAIRELGGGEALGTRASILSHAALANVRAARGALGASPGLGVLWFVPTVAQVPLVSWAMRGLRNPAGIVVEGAPFLAHGDWRRAVLRSPLFFLTRALLTRDALGRLAMSGRRLPIATASCWQADRARGVLPEHRIFVIPNGSPGMPLRKLWSRRRVPNIRVLGHGLHYKGVDLVFDAAERVRRRIPDLTVDWAWNGIRCGLLRWASRRDWVRLHQRVDPYLFLSEGTIALAPLRVSSGTNVFPNVLIEAMSAAVPLLTSDLPCHRELLGESGDATIVGDYSPEVWAQRVERLLLDPDELDGLSEALLERSRSVWQVPSLKARWDAFVEAMFARE